VLVAVTVIVPVAEPVSTPADVMLPPETDQVFAVE
jgi:hypothetical protein